MEGLLLTIVIGSHLRSGSRLTPGLGHLILSYTWILAPILITPLILLGSIYVPQESAEAMAPQTLVYGWALQFGVAIVPWFLAKMLHPSASAHLGGTWTSLALLNLGSAALWIGIFQEATRNLWSGFAYLLWAIALFPVMRQVLATVRADPTLEPDDAVMEMSGQPGTDWRS